MTFDFFLILMSLAAGAAAGLFYFGGLWWTVRRLPDTYHPALLMLSSFLIRIFVTVSVFYLVGDGQWLRITAALGGFLLVRYFMVRYIGADNVSFSTKGVHS